MAANDIWLQSTASPSGCDVWCYAVQFNTSAALNIYLYPIADGSDIYLSDSTVLATTPATSSGELDSTGDASAALIGAALYAGGLAATGSATTALVGAALDAGVLAGTGVASASLVGAALDASVLAGTGVASASLVGAALDTGVLAGTGVASTSLVGAAHLSATFTMTSGLSGVDHLIAVALLTAAGTSATGFAGASLGTGAWMPRPVLRPLKKRIR